MYRTVSREKILFFFVDVIQLQYGSLSLGANKKYVEYYGNMALMKSIVVSNLMKICNTTYYGQDVMLNI